ncbi:hypothetical protein A2617_04455 [Candidatus Daviesbacteria bacterium RIFOXYD1_FULL_41_10]|uniref:Uncharacterized protein n=1 Tax=Candidatus Daviesbacteria bacterium RIFOXYD1_FULL_41_10 TaxID=1797801 RepID=A0A1F5N0I7_9BACT|nr:MAG: hypothetical protein A2617_04455 [Candidatus Daviesbacteria bacterium RIFOXYD1_FULL_41_10]
MSAEAPRNSGIGEPLDLSTEIGIFIRTEGLLIKEAKEKKKETERNVAEAKAKEAYRKPPMLIANEHGKQIADQSGIRELITQAQAGLFQYYQAVQIGEVWSKYGSRYDFETNRDRSEENYRLDKIYGKDHRRLFGPYLKNHSVPSTDWNERQSYFIRLGWREGVNPNLDLQDSGYNYVEVQCNPWFDSYWGSDTLTVKSMKGHKVFKNDEWQDREELKKAILEAVKNPLYESFSIPKSPVPSMSETYRRMQLGEHG